jgi:hypothetical protein
MTSENCYFVFKNNHNTIWRMRIILFKVPNCEPYRSCIDKREYINKSDKKKRMEEHIFDFFLCLNNCIYLSAITLHEPFFFFSTQNPKGENTHLRSRKDSSEER